MLISKREVGLIQWQQMKEETTTMLAYTAWLRYWRRHLRNSRMSKHDSEKNKLSISDSSKMLSLDFPLMPIRDDLKLQEDAPEV